MSNYLEDRERATAIHERFYDCYPRLHRHFNTVLSQVDLDRAVRDPMALLFTKLWRLASTKAEHTKMLFYEAPEALICLATVFRDSIIHPSPSLSEFQDTYVDALQHLIRQAVCHNPSLTVEFFLQT